MTINLDVAAVLAAIVWPIVVVIVLLAYRSTIPGLIGGVAGRVQKFEFAGFSLELAQAKPFTPEWSAAPFAMDLRQRATAVEVSDSTAGTFLAQLSDETSGDYAEINLGSGTEWLTSRLYIMAILFSRMKAIDCFVFTETAGVRRRYVGWADPAKVRWALAKRCPWLEKAYAEAYAFIYNMPPALQPGDTIVVSHHGRLGYTQAPQDPTPAVALLREFLTRVQQFNIPLPATDGWVMIDDRTNTWEHSGWIDAATLETLLGDDLHKSSVRFTDPLSLKSAAIAVASKPANSRYLAVTTDEHRLEYLLRGELVVEQLSQSIAREQSGSA